MSAHNDDLKTFAPLGSKPHYNPDRLGKVEHISLELKVDFDNEILHGISNITLLPLRDNIETLEINAVDMIIHKITVDDNEVKFDYDSEKIYLYLNTPTIIDQKLQISIAYELEKPKMGLTFVKPDKNYPNKPTQIWTQGESEQSRYWYPCFDYPLQICTSEIFVEVPKNFTTVSNGLLVNQTETTNTRIDHWLQDQTHPSYLIALTAGEFVEIKDKYKDIEVNYYTQKGNQKNLQTSAKNTPKMIEFFSQKYGVEYPWKKYHQTWVHEFIWGGMENTTTTFNTDRALVDERAEQDYDFGEILIAHELTHQWFGDYIAIEHWSHLWVKEGAATYSEYLWTQHQKGQDEFNYYKLLETREYLDEDSSMYRRPIVTNVFRDNEDLYDRHSYSKGGLVYNMIRAELGDKLFEKTLKYFLTTHKHQNVNSWDFLNAIEKSTGRNLKPLFDQYVFRGGHPDFKISFSWDNDNKLGKLTVTQKQAENDNDHKNLFDLKISVAFGSVNSETKEVEFAAATLKLNKKEQSFYFPLEQKPDLISFDPENNYLKTVELDLSLSELKNQLFYDTDIINRIYAAEAIAKKGNLEALKTLAKSLKTDKFWAVRSEVAIQIGKIKLDQSVPVLIEVLSDTDPRVRKSAIDSLSNFVTPEVFESIFQLAKKGDSSYFTEKAAIMAVGILAFKLKGDYIKKAIELFDEVLKTRAGWNEVVRSGAIIGLGNLKDSKLALDKIIEHTKLGVSAYLRLAAISSLGDVSKMQRPEDLARIIDILDEISKDSYILTQRAVIAALSKIESKAVLPILSRIASASPYGRIKNYAEETIRHVSDNLGAEKTVNQIREEVDAIKKENQKLKSRLEELEAKAKEKPRTE